jgi:hypothetical protein
MNKLYPLPTIRQITGDRQLCAPLAAMLLSATVLSGYSSRAQSPGGVAPAAWYKADAPGTLFSDAGITQSTDSTTVYQWNEFTGTGYNLTQTTAGNRPLFSNAKTLVNFNPTVTFDNDYMGFQPAAGVNIIDRADGTLYAAGYTNTLTGCGFFGFDASNDYPGLHIYAGLYNLLFYTGGPGYQGLSANSFAAKTYFTAGGGWLNGGGATAAYTSAVASLNGSRTNYTGTQVQNAVLDNNARDIRIGWDSNYGALDGQLNELMIFENKLTSDQMDQVESYMAIKYGTTYANGTRDYKNSTGGTVWNAAGNGSYGNNIAGIARDDNGALYQKQSWSVNTGKQVLISTTGLANTNAANSGSLTDGQYLIWGDNGLAKSPAIAIAGIPGVNYRFGAVWKAQNTNSMGTVRIAWPKMYTTIKLMQSMDTVFDSSDLITNMADTQVVNGVTYAYADVTISDGQYFTFSVFVQAPGGVVANLLMWHKADDGVTTPGAKNTWRDVSFNGRDVTQSNNVTYQPELVTAAADTADSKVYFFNYNPFYYFDGTNDFFYRLNGNYFPSATSAGSAYGVMFHSASGGWRTPFGWGDDDPNLVRGNDEYYVTRDNGTVLVQNVKAGEIPAHIGGFSWKGSGAANNGIYLNVNGRAYGTTAYNIGAIDDNFAIGSEGFGLTGNGNEVFQGGIPEVFAYSADHHNSGGDEKLRINSYLAIKYGITLTNDSGTAVPNYLSSNSSVVWNATVNAGYNNNIAGIAYDYNSALQQKQSISENPGKQVLIGTTGLANTNALNATALPSDGQFLVWGDNGLAKTPAVYMPGMSTVNVRFKCVWKVQNTGSVGSVRVAWPAAGLNNLSLIRSADTVFDASDAVTSMNTNTQTINGMVYKYADVTLPDGQYFTFATYIEHAPGGVFAGLSYWYRADKDAVNTGDSTSVTSWTDYAMGTVAGQVGTNPYPLYHTGSATYLNFNPGINFTDGNQSLGNLLAQAIADTAYDIFTLTKEGITAGGANARVFSVLANKSMTTGNIHYWDGIGINYDGRLERYNTASGLAYLANPGLVNFPANSPGIMYHTFSNSTVSKGVNGAPNGTSAVSGPYGIIDGGFIFGSTVFSGNGSDNYSFKGNLGETIIYGSHNITPAERNRIDAYLAIKYGITLDTSRSYLNSGSLVVWDKNANKLHYNNVAGIGRDDISALFQKQSRSQITNNPNGQVTIGLGDIYATNSSNTDSIANGQFLLWGDNGNTQAMTNVAATYTVFTYNGNSNNRRMKRTWKVQNTGVGSALKIRFPIASVGTTTLPDESCAQYVILFAGDTTFTTNVTAAALTVNGTSYDAIHNFPNGASYFTFARLSSFTPGTVYLPDTTEATNEVSACASGAWTYFHRTGDVSRKVLATSGLTTGQVSNLTVTVTPEGAGYNNGTRITRLMDRVTTVADLSNGTYPGARVRIYYSNAELAAAQVPGAITNGWFRYNSYNADTIKTDIQTDGVFNPGKAIALTPSASGTEDGVPYVEFLNASPFASFVYVSSTENVGTVLPVTLLDFTAARQGTAAVLGWATASESANKGFSIERSTDSRSWQSIGFVTSAAANGNSHQRLDYTYTDKAPANGINYYRLKQTDFDSKYRYSVIRQVSFTQSGINISPNPASNYVIVEGLSSGDQVKVYDASGRMVKAIKPAQESVTISLDGWNNGLYHIHITGYQGTIISRKIVKVN